VLQVHERYIDSSATRDHLARFREHFGERFRQATTPTRFVVYGELRTTTEGNRTDLHEVTRLLRAVNDHQKHTSSPGTRPAVPREAYDLPDEPVVTPSNWTWTR
jgi:hypothetical protein